MSNKLAGSDADESVLANEGDKRQSEALAWSVAPRAAEFPGRGGND